MSTTLIIAALWLGAALVILLWFRENRRRRLQALDPAPAPGSTFTLGGRRFRRPLYLSNAQDSYAVKAMRHAGVAQPQLQPGEDPEAYVERVFAELHDKEIHYALVAALLIPADAEKWDRKRAPEVERFLEDLTEPEDKRIYLALLGTVLRPFCTSGLVSWRSSATSGSATTTSPSRPHATCPAPTTATGRG